MDLEEHLSNILKSGLREFLSTPILKRLENSKELFRWNNQNLKLVFEKYSEFIEEDIKDKTDKEKEEYLKNSDDNLKCYLNDEYQSLLYYLPYILWASHLIFDRTYSQLTYEAKEELRNYSDLNTPKKRKDSFINFFGKFVNEEVKDGGSESHWNKWTRLYFLSLYERFSIVIGHARKDINKLKQKKIPVMEIRKEILGRYRIPEEYWIDTYKSLRKDILARRWAKTKMQNDFEEKYISKMGFSDSYLIKVLREARKDAESHISCCRDYSNHKLIYLKWGDADCFSQSVRYKKDFLSEVKFQFYIESELPGMILSFVDRRSVSK
ncbi:hypothetical protein BH20ACI4_BH20ACI4_35150 [soil metagenome]